ncbi:Cobyric acid synthase [Fusobacterium polymorphum]|uniref:Cobyric acid synthase n=1 Tax=Fusobacterium polymorphum ATCC 10953 TaxID=393480 RepID=A5TUS5_FUSNP|nr:cobyric acid synthase [Fusobacterium polymorphum]EDK88650.1 adenosylcobyric acid synthase (glutamine-hydrolyzing) [Fusobacterium polymorphum ATCC 10953]UTI52033.1 cobyric acid synthase [Fusobacterium polymorphum]WRL68758.1 cobyric acid synthase [Fusobacterium polymorphum]CKG93247.1 Cobyric acid synthase [Fusobacterium polymorphum]
MKKANLMIVGTSSGAGKSLFVTALCRIFYKDKYKVSPFKAQNMALNSYITKDGKEMGRAQVVQAEASGLEPDVNMNPILLKPSTMNKIQIIVCGKSIGNMSGVEYNQYKRNLIPILKETYSKIESKNDIVVIEGAGSPAEINIKEEDISNFAMARIADAPVILVADIDRGGVFASIYGTIMLLKEEDRKRIKGIVINKFRGNKEVLKAGFEIIENLTGVKTLGVIPYTSIDIEDEDSLSEKYKSFKLNKNSNKIKISVIKLKHISNVTDIDALSIYDDAEIHFVTERSQIGNEDLLIIPGSKNTIDDLKWLKESGIAEEIIKRARTETIIFGICGGFQILGNKVKDPYHIEGDIEELNALGLLDLETIMENEKTLVQYNGKLAVDNGLLKILNNFEIKGYEIHQGITKGNEKNLTTDDRTIFVNRDNIIATYLHGIFDNKDFTDLLLNEIRKRKGLEQVNNNISYEEYKLKEFDKLEKLVRENVDIDEIYKILWRL